MPVDIATAAWLRGASLTATAENAAVGAAWGDLAVVSEILSPLALAADANAESVAQLAFLGVATAIDRIDVPGRREDAVGRLLDVTAIGGGYEDGERVFVLSARPSSGERTELTVLRRLA